MANCDCGHRYDLKSATYWHNHGEQNVSSSFSNGEDRCGFIRETENAKTGLMVTRCQLRKPPWYAWSRSLRMLEIAELSHCHACSLAGHCLFATAKSMFSSRI